jgi:hypothetical protein
MRCGISRSTNRSSPMSSQDRVFTALATPPLDTTLTTRSSSFRTSPLIGPEEDRLQGLRDRLSAHLRVMGSNVPINNKLSLIGAAFVSRKGSASYFLSQDYFGPSSVATTSTAIALLQVYTSIHSIRNLVAGNARCPNLTMEFAP